MRRTFVLPILGLAVLAPSLADAAVGHQGKTAGRAVKLTERLYQYASTGAPPASGTNSYIGTSDGTVGTSAVHGTVRGVNTYPGGSQFRGKGTIFDPAGSINIAFQAAIVSPGHISASGSFRGGTGRYTGARGTFTFTAVQQSDKTFLRVLKGRIT